MTALESLPIYPYLAEISRALTQSPSRFLVLTAETGAGKSTAVPVELLRAFPGKVLMLEGRRIAAVSVANRVAELLGEPCGKTAGYRVHGDSRVGAATRFEVLTEAILVRMLQDDPLLEGVSCVVLDEFHERSVYADTALAFLKESVPLRDDLFVLVMSATIDTKELSAYLGCPVVSVPGRTFPVSVEYRPIETGAWSGTGAFAGATGGSGALPWGRDLWQAVAACVRDVVSGQAGTAKQGLPVLRGGSSKQGSSAFAGGGSSKQALSALGRGAAGTHSNVVLAFLPGIQDLERTRELLAGLTDSTGAPVPVDILHGSVPLAEQRRILYAPAGTTPATPAGTALTGSSAKQGSPASGAPAGTAFAGGGTSKQALPAHGAQPVASARVILSSAIAETSLTVPGVTTVIDCGLARVSRLDVRTGMNRLVTERETQFSAEQRKGRAGRLAAGHCIRLWAENDVRVQNALPEILLCDVTPLVLECAEWGARTREDLDWLTMPSLGSWESARAFLTTVGALTPDGAITPKGKALLRLGVHPRIGLVALESLNGNSTALDYAARYGTDTGGAGVPKAGSATALGAGGAVGGGKNSETARLKADLQRRLSSLGRMADVPASAKAEPLVTEKLPGVLCMLAGYFDRLARHTGDGVYQLYNGRLARLSRESLEQHGYHGFASGGNDAALPRWILVVDGDSGERVGRIYRFETLPDPAEKTALGTAFNAWLAARRQKHTTVRFAENGSLKKTEDDAVGALVLKTRVLPASKDDVAGAWVTQVREKGLRSLPWSDGVERFLLRARFYEAHAPQSRVAVPENKAAFQTAGAPKSGAAPVSKDSDRQSSARAAPKSGIPAAKERHSPCSDETLAATVEDWLVPFMGGCTGGTTLTAETVLQALRYKLNGDAIDRAVPEKLRLANGKERRLSYEVVDKSEGVIPVLEVIIQEMFGVFETPRVLGVPVLLRLLSPARRPLQVTRDLENFWEHSWLEICKEMRGRYPKHNWDYTKPES